MGWVDDIFGGGKEAKGAERALDLERKSFDLAKKAYEEAREERQPYRRLAEQSMDQLRDIYLTGETPYTVSPGYDFRRGEGEKAINRMMAARGLYGSGARGKALSRFADDLASEEYGQGFNRLAALAGMGTSGQQFGQQLGQQALGQGMGALSRQGGYELTGGRARQSGYDRASSAAINTIAGLAGMYG